LLEFQRDQGINGVVPCGTTGESPTLSWEEHGAAVAAAVRMMEGHAGVLAGAGSNNTAEAIDGTRDAWSRGASGVLLVDCYYNGPSSLELRTEYYQRVLDAVPDVQIVPYVIPGRTGCSLGSADLAILHQQAPDRVPAVKSATGDLEIMRRDRELAGPSLTVFSGDDELTMGMMRDPGILAAGGISVISNLAPAAMQEMCAAQRSGDTARAETLNRALTPLCELVGCKVQATRVLPNGMHVQVDDRFRNPGPVKTMMAGLGMVEPVVRAPLGLMSAPAVALCRAALQKVHRESAFVLEPIEAAFGVSIAQRLSDDAIWSALAR
jgi:4-hydroxy-tetrahydrodipicolinate synthase